MYQGNSLDKRVQHLKVAPVANVFPNHLLVKTWILPQKVYHFLWVHWCWQQMVLL